MVFEGVRCTHVLASGRSMENLSKLYEYIYFHTPNDESDFGFMSFRCRCHCRAVHLSFNLTDPNSWQPLIFMILFAYWKEAGGILFPERSTSRRLLVTAFSCRWREEPNVIRQRYSRCASGEVPIEIRGLISTAIPLLVEFLYFFNFATEAYRCIQMHTKQICGLQWPWAQIL